MISNFHFEILTDAQKEKLVDTAYRIMEEIGMNIHLPEAVELLRKAVVTWRKTASASTSPVTSPKKPLIPLRPGSRSTTETEKKPCYWEGRNSYFGPGPTCPYFYDPQTGERRPSTKQDAADTAKVCDALPNIDYVMSLVMVGDQTDVLADIHEVDAMVRNSTKPICTWAFNAANMENLFQMCAAVAGGEKELREKPFLIVYSEPTSPLSHGKDA